jgi:Fe-S-cluster-containing dehydrogenase component
MHLLLPLIQGRRQLRTPACVEVCPTASRLFGDLDDPSDPVAELVRKGVAKLARPDLKIGGRVYYVGGHDSPQPGLGPARRR